MLEIIFVRHGESEMNKKGLYCGWTNSFLTDRGLEQAEVVSEKLAHEKIDLILSSDLDRCLATAEAINRFHFRKIIKENALKELNFGRWEGLSYNEICSSFPLEAKKWEKDHANFKMPEGESLSEMHERVNKAFDRIINKYDKGKIIIVTHSGVIRSILSQQICGGIEGCWKFRIDNCGITRLGFVDDFPILVGINQ